MRQRSFTLLFCLLIALPTLASTWMLETEGLPVLQAGSEEATIVSLPTDLGSWATTPPGSTATPGIEPQVTLPIWETGYVQVREQPQYWLGDAIDPPEQVDWEATEAEWKNAVAQMTDSQGKAMDEAYTGFLFDARTKRLYATWGGRRAFTWVLTDGSHVVKSYLIGDASSTRPKRIFWTDYPYSGPKINLSGKSVRFFGRQDLIEVKYERKAVTIDGQEVVMEEKIVQGLHLDKTTSLLSAAGEMTGQVVMAYYDDGTYTDLEGVIVVEIAKPNAIDMKGTIGEALRPFGGGYSTEGLIARPVQTNLTDDKYGPYYYQHTGMYSYSPKHGNVYPLRPTVGQSVLMQVYWMEADNFKTEWPFEWCHYECDWGEDVPVFVRGNLKGDAGLPFYIPTEYTVELMDYQTPEGHAAYNLADNALETNLIDAAPAEKGGELIEGEGYSLLRLTADDDLWFLPIRSVISTNEEVFPDDIAEWPVGQEIVPRDTEAARALKVDASVSGYLYKADSDTNYNAELYYDPEPYKAIDLDISNGADGSIQTEKAPSVLYAVREGIPASEDGDPSYLEMWWMRTIQEEGMSVPLYLPAITQCYHAVWPSNYANPSIVIASQMGSANACIIEDSGYSAELRSGSSAIHLPSGSFFTDPAASPDAEAGGGLAFWVNFKDHSTTLSSRLLTLKGDNALSVAVNGSTEALTVTFTDARAAEVKTVTATLPCAFRYGWNVVFIDFKKTGVNELLVKGFVLHGDTLYVTQPVYETQTLSLPACADWLLTHYTTNTLGAGDGAKTIPGTGFGSLAFYRDAGVQAATDMVQHSAESLAHCSAYFTPQRIEESLRYVDEISGDGDEIVQAADVSIINRSSPTLKPGGTTVESSEQPKIYAQNDPSKVGYNPNEEHAFIRSAGNNQYTVYALRCDLNTMKVPGSSKTKTTSRAGVLVQYTRTDGRPAMQWFGVELTSAAYPDLAGTGVVGKTVPGPHPLDLFDNPWLKETYWAGTAGTTPIYRDRKHQLWFRKDGTESVYMYYPMQDGFYFPTLDANAQPPVGTPIPWLTYLTRKTNGAIGINPSDDAVISGTSKPFPWQWTVTWPEGVPEMKIGQTLTTAKDGLPEVWNAKSVAVLYMSAEKTVMLYDPTTARHPTTVPEISVEDAPSFFGFDLTDKGNVIARNGKYIFRDLPPSISGRFYFDTTASSLSKAFCFVGKLEETAGSSTLFFNAPDLAERDAMKAIKVSPGAKKSWDALIDSFSSNAAQPSVINETAKDGLVITYRAADHYALTALGGGVGYVTLIENDGPESIGVQAGDAINMHVIKVVPEYYQGQILARQDPENLLSQQLSILYNETFAGTADAFEFEWRKAPPSAGKTISDSTYQLFTSAPYITTNPQAGLTRFILGGQGDTLANMVNTFYAMRYRAKKGTPGWTLMKTALEAKYGETLADTDERLWSDWCGPTLAEGWIQRVLNNVTPFTQRMQNLYENRAEILTSMIQQAGGPYQGDVAMNQDNLTNVGLIQLYMTLLNKAESMSLAQKINDGEANKQLLLAAERLADLYMVLGNEAYADALNPTIGFGSEFGVEGGAAIDVGSYASSLFCFDNQVPTLLDEELALLRGRSVIGNNAFPLMTNAPYYNRLVWNFTKGITRGEVAYAVNYDSANENGDAVINENDAVKQYPQGHGDAYGHYLSAIKGFYRLLRNPYFTWNTGMGEMLVADAIVNVDYYDEQRFAEIAASMAETAALTVDRTARKAYAENDFHGGAGYLDEEPARGFGYGEWGTKGGIGATMGWMVANSLLPASEDNSIYWQLDFDGTTTLTTAAPYPTLFPETKRSFTEAWTLEFQVADLHPLAAEGASNPTGIIFHWRPEREDGVYLPEMILFLDSDGTVTFRHSDVQRTFPVTLPHGHNTFVISYGMRKDGEAAAFEYTLRILDGNGVLLGSTVLPVDFDDIAEGGTFTFGQFLVGRFYEMRFWDATRTDAEIRTTHNFVNPKTTNLIASLRTFSEEEPSATFTLADDTVDEHPWEVANAKWTKIVQNGSEIYFSDQGMERIDRTTVTALKTLPETLTSIERTVSQLDMGLNPLGFSDSTIPFDLSAAEMEDGKSHYEQIAERATVALNNAATVLDRAQEAASQLRILEDARQLNEETLAKAEADYDAQLIGIFGTPYSDDIGPGKTYKQGYEGPDLTHFMWMDLELYGFESVPESDKDKMTLLAYDVPKWALNSFLVNYLTNVETTYKYEIRPDGLIAKPSSIQGKRRTQGELQQAYGEFLAAYREALQAEEWHRRHTERLTSQAVSAEVSLAIQQVKLIAMGVINIYKAVEANKRKVLQVAHDAASVAIDLADLAKGSIGQSFPSIVGAGLTVNADPSAIANAAVNAGVVPTMITLHMAKYTAQMGITASDFSWLGDLVASEVTVAGDYAAACGEIRDTFIEYVDAQMEAKNNLENAYIRLVAATENIKTVQERGLAIMQEREAYRARAVNKLTKSRYNDMFFRQVQHQALDRYEAAFLLAQRYVYLAAQAYDYETGLLSTDKSAGDAFRAEIVAARTIGRLEDGEPTLAGSSEAPSLSDILARMNANWSVLKPRLMINNPQKDVTWFSLRSELLRIAQTEDGDAAWHNALATYWVDDLSAIPGYVSFCEPFAEATITPEPGLVIEFPSEIIFSKNFFGLDLTGGDSAFDPTYFTTKIAGAGIKFEGYNLAGDGQPATYTPLAKTPHVYLVPMGMDRMRVPGGDKNTILEYAVRDQVVPLPYTIGSTHLDDPDWLPSYSGTTGGIDVASRIRRYPSFRASLNDASDDDALNSTRLIGRSVWNTRWALILPAGTLGSNREAALNAFIYGSDTNHDGTIDCPGVRDIKVGFRTYSHAGN